MPVPILFWTTAALCAVLLVALSVALRRLYAVELAGRAASPAAAEGWSKLDELLSMLIALQEQGVSYPGTVSREDFGKAVLDCACRLMKCDRGSVMLWDEKEGCLKIVAARSLASEKSQRLFLKPGEGVAGKAFASAQSLFIADPAADPRYVSPGAGDVEPFVSIPLIVKGRPVGVLNLHAKAGAEPFSDYNVKFLGILAGEASAMLHNMELFDSLQTYYREMVSALSRAVDAKDARPSGRAERARVRARALAAELGLPEAIIQHVEHAALLHDVGKIGVDEAILRKPGALTPEEYEQVKRHPIIGHEILSSVRYLGPATQMVLYHQERYDGGGYPEGLKAEEIPLGARIVAVLDAWDAMTSDRPYRKALTRDAALAELASGAGAQFDPKVVDAFLRIEERERPASPAGGGAR
jgi:GAF domain-containing protein